MALVFCSFSLPPPLLRHMDRCKANEQQVLLQSVDQPSATAVSTAPLPAALQLPQSAKQPDNPLPYLNPKLQQPQVEAQGDPNIRVSSRTTLWRRKRKLDQAYSTATTTATTASTATTATTVLTLPRRKEKRVYTFNCRLCGQPKTKEFGHSRFRSENFCSSTAGCSVEEWLAEKRAKP